MSRRRAPDMDGTELHEVAAEPDGGSKAERQLTLLEAFRRLQGDYGNIALLLVLYTLQGIPMGLSEVIPMLLREKSVSYSDIGTFSLCSYPFALKLLWAPIVDAAYLASCGRRKTWLVPTQLLIGCMFLGMSFSIDHLLGDQPQVWALMGMFFLLYFLCATQDIAVDGWALTLLRPENVGYASTTNAIGQTLGWAIGFTGFMVVERFKVATLSAFMFFWGIVFVLVTLCVAVLKTEGDLNADDQPEGVLAVYKGMLSMFRLGPVMTLVRALLTWKFTFAISEKIAPLKLQDSGIPKEHLAYMGSILTPVSLLLPALVANRTSGPRPFDVALHVYPLRALLGVASAIVVTALSWFPDEATSWISYTTVFLLMLGGVAVSQTMFVSQMAFFARISDPAMGGTYMTMLNTVANLGGMWPGTVGLKLLDATTCKVDTCLVTTDGFYVLTVLCLVYGLGWWSVFDAPCRRLQQLKTSDWNVLSSERRGQ